MICLDVRDRPHTTRISRRANGGHLREEAGSPAAGEKGSENAVEVEASSGWGAAPETEAPQGSRVGAEGRREARRTLRLRERAALTATLRGAVRERPGGGAGG